MLPTTPTIEIHLALDVEEETAFEIRPLRSPYSPKFPSPMAYSDSDADDFRPVHLFPPPTVSPVARPRPIAGLPADKKGIDHSRFEQLLKASRERPQAQFGHARSNSAELRRQATLKAHTAKALERRALFLSKIRQAASPHAIESPVTPPESPAVFHFSLPSPGLQSPLVVFEKLAADKARRSRKPGGGQAVAFPTYKADKDRSGWVEEVDFKARARTTSIRNARGPVVPPGLTPPAPHLRHGRRASAHALPSLDQITARLVKASAPSPPNDLAPTIGNIKASPRPLRLGAHRRSPSSPLATSLMVALSDSLQTLPVGPAASSSRLPAFLKICDHVNEPTPITPTIIVSAPADTVHEPLSEPPITAPVQDVRTRRRHPDSLSTESAVMGGPTAIRSSFYPLRRPVTSETRIQTGLDMLEKLRRRSSAPAALPALAKDDHPVLSMKGGF